MKIILVNKFHYIKGGSETYYFSLANALEKMGHEVHYFSMHDKHNLYCEDAKYFVSHREYNTQTSIKEKLSAASSLIWSREARDKFELLCEAVSPDIIHLNLVHRQITLSILDARYLQTHQVPIVYTAHEYVSLCPCYTLLDGNNELCDDCSQGDYLSCIKKRCVKDSYAKSSLAVLEALFIRKKDYYNRINLTIAPSIFLKNKLIEGGFPSKKVIALQNFLPDSIAQQINKINVSDVVDPYILFFGRLSKEKGVSVLIKSFAQSLSELAVPIRLKIVGSGADEAELKKLAKSCGVSDYVDFDGFKSGNDLRSIVKNAMYTVMPSVWYENMPYSGLESLASGVPVIGSCIGGIPEFVIDGRTGFLFSPGDVTSLSQAIIRAVSLPIGKREEMSRRCLSYISDNCSESEYVNQLLKTYKSLL